MLAIVYKDVTKRMNNSKYKDSLYEFRPVSDLKDMLDTSAEIYADRAAYLIKEVLGGEYKPVYFPQVKSDVDSLGTKFIEMGLKGKKIAVIGENSYHWVLTYFATTNGTGVIVPLDRELPPNEIRNLLQRSEVSAIVFSRKMAPIVKEALKRLTGIDYTINMSATNDEGGDLSLNKLIGEGKELLEAGSREFVDAIIDREAMCSLLFTSGTMGLAKGVMLSHKNLSANVYNMSKYVAVSDHYVGLSVLPMHHSYEMTCHVLTGIYEPMHKKIWKQAETNKKDKKMRGMISVSRKLKLYNQPTIRKIFNDVHTATGGNIKLFIAGGAATNPKIIEDFEAMGFPMIQGYGMTECAPIIAVNKDRYSKAASAGLPMPGTEVKIVEEDENGIGEIICRGESVMLGYFGDPVETDKVLKNGW